MKETPQEMKRRIKGPIYESNNPLRLPLVQIASAKNPSGLAKALQKIGSSLYKFT